MILIIIVMRMKKIHFIFFILTRHTCGYCDYSVPTAELLKPHEKLHTQPNRNLLATQSIMNLTKLKPVSADIQLAHSAEMADDTVTDVHDHLNLYENIDSADQMDCQANGYVLNSRIYWLCDGKFSSEFQKNKNIVNLLKRI